MASDISVIRTIVVQHGRLSATPDNLSPEADLYKAGLTSLATVGVMLALEDHFEVEFPNTMLNRKTFASLESLSAAIDELVG
jgi:acyl carrier protein